MGKVPERVRRAVTAAISELVADGPPVAPGDGAGDVAVAMRIGFRGVDATALESSLAAKKSELDGLKPLLAAFLRLPSAAGVTSIEMSVER